MNINATPEQICHKTKKLSGTQKQQMAMDDIRHEFLILSYVITSAPYRHIFQDSPSLPDEIGDVTSAGGVPSKELVTALTNTFKTEKFRLRCINQADSPEEFAIRDIIFSLEKLLLSIRVSSQPPVPLSVKCHPWITGAAMLIMLLSLLAGCFIHPAIMYTIVAIPVSVVIASLLGQIIRSDVITMIAALLLPNVSVLFILHHYAL